MAQLKDLIVSGATRLIGDVFANKIQITSISAPTSSGGSTYGVGSNGQILKSNGTSAYWTSENSYVQKSGDTMTGRLTMSGKAINQIVTGTGTAGGDQGSSNTTTRYKPAEWKFTTGLTATNGDIFTIKIPVAGHDYGVWMSIDNGVTYYPVNRFNINRLTTQYAVNHYIQVIFDANAQTNDIYARGGAMSRTNVTGGAFRVINDYDSGNTICQIRTENGRFYVGATGMNPYSLMCLDNSNKFSMLLANTTNAGIGTNKTINTNGKYKLPAVILYYSANNTTAANTLASSTYNTFWVHQTIDLRYSHNYTTTFTTNTPTYIECTIDSNGYWSPTTKCITQTFESGKYYIYLGQTYSTAYQLSLATDHPCYYYDGTNLTDYTKQAIKNWAVTQITAGAGLNTTSNDTATDGGTITTTGTLHLTKTAVTAGNYGPSSNASPASTANGGTFSVPYVSVDKYGRLTGASTKTITLKPLTIGGKTYDGSSNITITSSDLGLTSPMTFKGVTTTNLSDQATTNPITLKGGTSLTAAEGNVVLDANDNEEYIWSSGKWHTMGVASSYAMANHIHGNLTNEGSLTSNVTIANNDQLVIVDNSDSNKIARASIKFDGSTSTQALSKKGSWESFLPISGGTLTGNVTLNKVTGSSYCYGNELPSTGTEGQIFFQTRTGGASVSSLLARIQAIEDKLYPVGSIYISVNNTSPATLFGGTWVQIKDTFLLACGNTYAAASTGGEATHTLTESELPNTKGVLIARNGSSSNTFDNVWPKANVANNVFSSQIKTDTAVSGLSVGSNSGYTELTMEFGSDQAHNNMPPYLAVYVWKRTA